jgi:hypothetical protein
MGLLHIIHRLVSMEWLGWPVVAEELRRIARVAPDYGSDWDQGYVVKELLFGLPWDKVFDFCERLHNKLAQDAMVFEGDSDRPQLLAPASDVRKYISDELGLLFLEENLAFEFSNGLVLRRGRRHTADQITRAGLVLGDPRLAASRAHFNKALGFFRKVSEPDYENAVKEAVCAVEAAAQVLFSSEGVALDDIIKKIEGSGVGEVPKPIAKTFYGLYGFRNSGKGVAHGGAGTGSGPATKELAEYALAVAASQIVFLVDFSLALEPDVPF